MKSDVYEYIQSFIKTFKENTNIKSYEWTLKYNSNDEGLLVLGDNPMGYDPDFKRKEYIEYKANAIKYKNNVNFGLRFNDITINKISLNGSKELQFFHDLGVILVNQYYFDYIIDMFFTKYIDKYICQRGWVALKYVYIYCNGNNFTDSDVKSFPTISFKHIEINYPFELNYNDLFSKEKDGNIYFLIVYDLRYDAVKVGKPFLKKYTFTVDNDKNTISFFVEKKEDENENLNNNRNYIIIIVVMFIVFLILIGIIIFVVYKLIKQKQKNKKKANELDEDYEYMPQNENSINSNGKLGV